MKLVFNPISGGLDYINDIGGAGIVGRVAEFVTNTKTLQAAKLIAPTGGILTLVSASDYTLTIPATGTVALLATANVFTVPQMIDGTTNAIQLRLQGHSTQTANLLTIEDAGAVLTAISNTGRFISDTASSTSARNDRGFFPFYISGYEYGIELGYSTRYCLQITTSNTTDFRYRTYVNGAHATLQSDFTNRFVVLGSTGAVGINVSEPYELLEIRKDQSTPTSIQLQNATDGGNAQTRAILKGGSGSSAAQIGIINSGNTTYPSFANWFVANANGSLDGMAFWTEGSKPIKFATASIDALTLDGSTGSATMYTRAYSSSAVVNVLDLVSYVASASTGSAAGFGAALKFTVETATDGANRQSAKIASVITEAANATFKSKLQLSAYDTAERLGIEIYADGTISLVGIGGVTPTARLHLPAGGTAANTAPLKLTTQASALSTEEQGTFELVGNSLQFTQLVKRRGVVMSQSTRTADFQLVSSAAESATIITAEHGANYLEVGKTEEIVLRGTVQKDVGTPTNTLTIRVKYAGATIHTIVSSSNAIAANTVIEIIIIATCRTVGASGTLQINSIVRIDGDIITPAAPSLVTIDTTTAQNTTVTAQFTNSSATNNLVIHQGRVLCIEPNR